MKTRRNKRCPNYNFVCHAHNNQHFFSFKNVGYCERNYLYNSRIFHDTLSKGGTWEESEELVSELGYYNTPSPLVIGFVQRVTLFMKTLIQMKKLVLLVIF